MTTVLLIRHGRTTANASGVLAGRTPGIDLDERGRTQAEALAARLAAVPLAAVVSSPLERTHQTAEALIAARPPVPLHLDEQLTECDYGHWSGRDLKTLAKEPLWKTVQAHPAAAVFPGGEAMAAMSARAVTAVRRWNTELGEHATYAVVTHGDIIKSIAADALGMHLDLFQRLQVDPCSVTVIRYTATRPFILRLNDTGGDVAALIPPKRRSRRASARANAAESDAAVGGGAGA
ncbi:MSMEG_4193 family putative phosphomutase [Actinocrinis puniceicyclus]|uniref:MSMEG_4193 family putative phosphomutase n=1 Tax=Actinocrinis puniceicyclus TaxID=977794 RepID=A0A8J7WIM3_9ACTN|nr:MSMEG_4193 family putative phosphomutase [Actinocrinis puniceicyclus]MBS2961610.1 MSMEG_4193 family putative phosphomutase [Actinocrinis puniceicyclus]